MSTQPKAPERKSKAGPVVMDSRKFLGAINDSVQAKVAAMEDRVAELGRQANSNWSLACLRGDHLFIEDVKSHDYYVADYHREKGGTIVIENIRPIKVVENKKKSLFEANCRQLIESLEENDQKGMAVSFNKMAGQRFSSRAIPFSGIVKTRDGKTHCVNVASESVIDEATRPKLIAALIEGMSDQVTVEGKMVTGGTFVGQKIRLPVTEWSCRKAVARQMRSVAQEAYWSPGFQDRAYNVAKLIYDDKVEEAVKSVTGFFVENQEFTLLNHDQLKTLVENALATKCCFNQQLCNDVATLFWRTNLKVNKRSIIDEWRETAKKAGHPVLLENVRILEETQNFEAAYDKFINLVFNEANPREVQADAYKTALKALRETPKIRESKELSGKIDELIERLEQPEADHAVIAEVEDLLAEVKNEMAALDTLDDFDKMPGEKEKDVGDLLGKEEPAEATNVTFNINIGKGVDVAGAPGKEEGLEGLEDLGKEEGEEEEGKDEELEALLGKGKEEGKEEEGDELAELLKGESTKKSKLAIAESDDPYAFDAKVKLVSTMGIDYGTKPIEIAEDCMKAVQAMIRIVEHNKLNKEAILERAEELASAGLKVAGIRVPERKQDKAIEQVCEAFFDELERRSTIGENQYKGPWRHIWGRKKAAINRREGYTKKESKRPNRAPIKEEVETAPELVWLDRQDDGVLGEYAGVKFVLDHGNSDQLPPVLLSEDGEVEIPIPEELIPSAFGAAELSEDDPNQFVEWLDQNIEQLRPITENDKNQLDEAVAKITATADGKISVEVDSEGEEVSVVGPEVPEIEPGAGMAPIEPLPEPVVGGPGEEMPDFEGDVLPGEEEGEMPEVGEEGPEEEGEVDEKEEGPEEEEEEEGVVEDRDVTEPTTKKYNTTKENHRKNPTAKKPAKTDDKLEGFYEKGGGTASGVKVKKLTPKK